MSRHSGFRGTFTTLVLVAVFAIWLLPRMIDAVISAFNHALPYIFWTLGIGGAAAFLTFIIIRYLHYFRNR